MVGESAGVVRGAGLGLNLGVIYNDYALIHAQSCDTRRNGCSEAWYGGFSWPWGHTRRAAASGGYGRSSAPPRGVPSEFL